MYHQLNCLAPLLRIPQRITGKMKHVKTIEEGWPGHSGGAGSVAGDANFHTPLTWSWTSSSHNSSCMIRSKGRKSASLKWKWGGSFQSVRTSVSISWMKETAFWDTCLSLWQAACKIQRRVEHHQDFTEVRNWSLKLLTHFVVGR